ncbi:MAG: hypothetical protein AAF360_15520 [Pseudomonadota bacterium]
MRALLVLCIVAASCAPAFAASHVSPQLASAVEAWLNDDDASSIPQIGELAGNGDRAAAMLLGRIGARPEVVWSEWLLSKSPEERSALLRLGGNEPLTLLAAAGDEVAAAFRVAERQGAGFRFAETLYEAGELQAARTLVWRALEAGRLTELLELPTKEPLYKSLDFMFWMEGWTVVGWKSAEPQKWVASSNDKGRIGGLILTGWITKFIAADKPLPETLQRVAGFLDGKPIALDGDERAYASELLRRGGRRDAGLRPFWQMCDRLCPGEVGACMLEAVNMSGGYGVAERFDTPYETLIPAADYAASPRAVGELKRRMTNAFTRKGPAEMSCLAAGFSG